MISPSRPPVRLLGAAAALVGAAVSLTRIGDYDIWYHLRAGRFFLESDLPATDPFSFTASAQPLSVQSWFAGVLYRLAEVVGGIPGVQLFNAALIAAALWLLFATTRLHSDDRADAPLSVLLLVVTVFAARFRLGARPHVIEYVLLAADLYLLQAYSARGRAALWLVPVIQVVWVNVHGSHILGPALPLLFLAGLAAQRLLPERWSEAPATPVPIAPIARRLVGVSAATAIASLLNPDGWRALQFAFKVAGMGSYMARIGEWQPITRELLFGYGARYTWGFSVLACAAVAAAALSVARRRVEVIELLLLAVFGLLAVRGVRLIPEFAIATVPGTFRGLAPLAGRLFRGRSALATWSTAGVLVAALAAAPLDRAYEPGLGAKERIFPGAALEFARRVGVQGNVFNSFAFGDWLVYHAPERKVFIHGRNEVFPEAFYEDFRAAHRDAAVFHRLANEWNLQWTLLEYTLTDYNNAEAMPVLIADPDWVPIYWDRVAVIYVRRSGPNAALAQALGLPLLRPNRFDFEYVEKLVQRGQGPAVLADVNALLARAPDNEEAHLAAATALRALGRPDFTRRALEAALKINPKRAMTRAALGLLALEGGDKAGAKAHFEASLAIDPGDPAATWGMGELGVKIEAPRSLRPAAHP